MSSTFTVDIQKSSRLNGKSYVHKLDIESLIKQLSSSAVQRDKQSGLPEEEVHCLRASGLLPLVIPEAYGGVGANWVEALKVVQQVAKIDGSIGQLYSNQIILSMVPLINGNAEQADYYGRATAQHHLFWGNAFNTRDTRLTIEPAGEHFRVNGTKSFGTGAAIADLRIFSAVQEGIEFPIIFILPKEREGVIYNDDWDNMGQRRTASGSFTFHNVRVMAHEIIPPPATAFSTLLFVVNQLAKAYVYLGIAEGALTAAQGYTKTMTRPWLNSGVESATQDPYILHHYGDLWTQFQAANALAERAAQTVQTAWEKGENLTLEERGEAAIPVFAAKAFITKVGLEITSRIFEVMGSRATSATYGFDRYWRDLRTFTLHDSVDFKLRDVGNWVLNQELPIPTPYS
ncbi:MAG: monooxygenase [Leptolyngbyaceae cyanobacterium SM2_5_2]|nr:monooxygenase [Leptolyngbyaceae cyanobacterium SM2_5_2]